MRTLLEEIKGKGLKAYEVYIIAKNRRYVGSEEYCKWYQQEGVTYTISELEILLYMLGKEYVCKADVLEYFEGSTTLPKALQGLKEKGVMRRSQLGASKAENKIYEFVGVGVSAIYISGSYTYTEMERDILKYFKEVSKGTLEGFLEWSGRKGRTLEDVGFVLGGLEKRGLVEKVAGGKYSLRYGRDENVNRYRWLESEGKLICYKGQRLGECSWAVYVYLRGLRGDEKEVKRRKIAEVVGWSKEMVNSSILKLVEVGLLEVINNKTFKVKGLQGIKGVSGLSPRYKRIVEVIERLPDEYKGYQYGVYPYIKSGGMIVYDFSRKELESLYEIIKGSRHYWYYYKEEVNNRTGLSVVMELLGLDERVYMEYLTMLSVVTKDERLSGVTGYRYTRETEIG